VPAMQQGMAAAQSPARFAAFPGTFDGFELS
jgi:hypothetical protein